MNADDVKRVADNYDVAFPEGRTCSRGTGEGEVKCSHIDTGQVTRTGWKPCGWVLGKAVGVDVLAWSARPVERGLNHTVEQWTACLFSLGTVKLDGCRGDGVISDVVGTLVVEVVERSLVGLLLNVPEERGDRVVEDNLCCELGDSGCLGVVVGDLDVLEQVLMCVTCEETTLHGVEEDEVDSEGSVLDLSVVGGVEGCVRGVGVYKELALLAKVELDADVVVLESDDREGLTASLGEPEWKLDPELGDSVTINVDGVTVVGPLDELSLGGGSEHKLVDIDVDVGCELVEDLEVVIGEHIDLVVTDLELDLGEHGVSQDVGPPDGIRTAGVVVQLTEVDVDESPHLGCKITVTTDLHCEPLSPRKRWDVVIDTLDSVVRHALVGALEERCLRGDGQVSILNALRR